MPGESKSETTLILKRTISGPRGRVFDAWTSPDLIRRWFCPDESFSVAVAEVDLRVGGAFRIGMQLPDKSVHTARGVYREIKRPEKLVFTWIWDHDPVETLVTLTFNDRGASTEIVLKHEFLQTIEKRDKHAEGWSGCLAHLEKFLLHQT